MKNKSSITAKGFVSSVAKFSISSWSGFFLGIIAVSVTTRVFSPELVGQLNMFNSAVSILISFALVGMGGVVNRFFYDPPNGWSLQEMFTRCLVIPLIVLFVTSLFIFSSFMDDFFLRILQTEKIFVRVLFVLNACSIMILTYFLSQFYRYKNDAYHYNIQQILIQFFSKLFVIIAAFVNPTLEIVLLFNTIGIFLLMLVYIYIQGKSIFRWKDGGWLSTEFRPLYRFAFFSWPNEVVLQLSAFMLPYFITTLLSAKDLGIYSSAGFFVAAFSVLQGGFRTYWAAFMYKYYRDEQKKICKIHSYVSLGIILLMSLCIIFQHVAYMLIGEAFHDSRLFFTLVLIPPLLGLWEQTTCYGVTLSKKNEQYMVISIFSIVIYIIGVYVCIQKWNLLGASIGGTIAAVIRYVLLTWRGQKYYRSIQSIFETIIGLLLLLLLSFSNVIFYQNYWYELIFVAMIIIFSLITYKRALSEIIYLIRR